MLRWFSATAAVFTLIVLGFAQPGCSDRSCIEWKTTEGACPSAASAVKFFGPCSNVQTIDSQGQLIDGDLCCYDVTRTTRGLACQPMNDNTGGGITRPPSSFGTGGGQSSSAATTSSSSMSMASSSSVGPGGPASSSSGMGGMVGMGGMGGGGMGGMGGSPSCEPLPCGYTDGQPLSGCLACANHGMCASEADTCSGDASCADFEACLANCAITDHACISACASASPEGASIFADFIECEICVACATACAGDPVAGLTACGMGGSTATGNGGSN